MIWGMRWYCWRMGTSKTPFHFVWCGRSPSEWSLLLEHQQDNPAQEDWTCYCTWVRVTLGEGGGDQPPPPCMDQFLNCQHVSGQPWRMNYRGCGIGPWEGNLFFGRQFFKEGFPLGYVMDVGFWLGGPVNMAGREAQVETTMSIVQEGCWVIADAVVGKRTEARGPGHPQGTTKTNWTPTAVYNINKWMWGLEEDASKEEVRNNEASNCGTEQKNAHSQHLGRSRRWCKRQGTPWLLRDTSSGSPSSGGGSSCQGSEQSSHHATMMRLSRESNWAGRTGRGLRVKVNLPIFKNEKTKDAVTYHSWW